jgi:hypothetical protein
LGKAALSLQLEGKLYRRCRMAQQFQIIEGPNKFDLMQSLFSGDSGHRIEVAFTIEGTGPATHPVWDNCRINTIERKDGTGESWSFKAYAQTVHRGQFNHVEGTYDTKTRKGEVSIIDSDL